MKSTEKQTLSWLCRGGIPRSPTPSLMKPNLLCLFSILHPSSQIRFAALVVEVESQVPHSLLYVKRGGPLPYETQSIMFIFNPPSIIPGKVCSIGDSSGHVQEARRRIYSSATRNYSLFGRANGRYCVHVYCDNHIITFMITLWCPTFSCMKHNLL